MRCDRCENIPRGGLRWSCRDRFDLLDSRLRPSRAPSLPSDFADLRDLRCIAKSHRAALQERLKTRRLSRWPVDALVEAREQKRCHRSDIRRLESSGRPPVDGRSEPLGIADWTEPILIEKRLPNASRVASIGPLEAVLSSDAQSRIARLADQIPVSPLDRRCLTLWDDRDVPIHHRNLCIELVGNPVEDFLVALSLGDLDAQSMILRYAAIEPNRDLIPDECGLDPIR